MQVLFGGCFTGSEKAMHFRSFNFELSVHWSAALLGSIAEVSWKQGLYLKIMREKSQNSCKHTSWKFIRLQMSGLLANKDFIGGGALSLTDYH